LNAVQYNTNMMVFNGEPSVCRPAKALFRAPDPTQLNSTQLAVELS